LIFLKYKYGTDKLLETRRLNFKCPTKWYCHMYHHSIGVIFLHYGLIFFAKFVCLLCFGFLLLRDPAMLLGSVVKSGGERRKRSWNKKRSVEGMFPKARLSRNMWTQAEQLTGQGSGTGKGYCESVFQVEPEPEQVNQSETYNRCWLWFRRSCLIVLVSEDVEQVFCKHGDSGGAAKAAAALPAYQYIQSLVGPK
jgi:hypothetical protein